MIEKFKIQLDPSEFKPLKMKELFISKLNSVNLILLTDIQKLE